MSRLVAVTSLLAQVRQRADIESAADRFPDAEVINYISQSYAEMYNLIIQSGEDYFLSSAVIPVTANTDKYDLPADFYFDRGVDIQLGGYTLSMERWLFDEREQYQYAGGWTFGMPIAYSIEGSQIWFKPLPAGVYSPTLWYYPAPPVLTSGSSIDGFGGMEEFVVADAACKVLAKEERDYAPIAAQRENAKALIKTMLSNRSKAFPKKVTRLRGRVPWWKRPMPR
jgi:hypothetical protein